MKHIIVLAISVRDGMDMKRAIEDVYEEVEEVAVRICTGLHDLTGIKAEEFVMTQEFSSQRSIRMLDAAHRAVKKTAS